MSNTSCDNVQTPNASYYFSEMDKTSLGLTGAVIVLAVLVLLVFAGNLVVIYRYCGVEKNRRKLRIISGMIPVTAISCTAGICVPRAITAMDGFVLLYFALVLFTFINLIKSVFGGREAMCTKLADSKIVFAIRPTCCCCKCLPKLDMTKNNLMRTEYLVTQVAFVRPLLIFVASILNSDQQGEQGGHLKNVFSVISLVSILSTVISIYGCFVLLNFTAIPLAEYKIGRMFRLIQMTIVFYNFQGSVFNMLSSRGVLPCSSLLPSHTRGQVYHFMLLVTEILILSLLAMWFLRPSVNKVFDKHPAHHKLVTSTSPSPIQSSLSTIEQEQDSISIESKNNYVINI